MKIKDNHSCWILNTTLVDNEGKCLDQQFYQHTSSIDMLKLLVDRKKTKVIWETEKGSVVKYHLFLIQICSYGSAGVLASDTNSEELLELHAKEEQALIDAQS
jgi:hypothetical protein